MRPVDHTASQIAILKPQGTEEAEPLRMKSVDQILESVEAEKNDDCWLWRDRWAD